MKRFVFLRLGFLTGVLAAAPAFAYDCKQMASELFNELGQTGSHTLTIEKSGTTHRFDGGLHGSYGRRTQTFSQTTANSIGVDIDIKFSDRDNFSSSRVDKQRIVFYRNGEVEIVLVTWGNTRLWLDDSVCLSEGLITGSVWEANGKSRVTITLVKS